MFVLTRFASLKEIRRSYCLNGDAEDVIYALECLEDKDGYEDACEVVEDFIDEQYPNGTGVERVCSLLVYNRTLIANKLGFGSWAGLTRFVDLALCDDEEGES